MVSLSADSLVSCHLDSLSPNFERRNSQNNQRDRSSSDGALGLMRKKFRTERKGINENWRHPVDEKKEPGNSKTINSVETRPDGARLQEKHSGENNQSNLKRNNHSGTNNRNSGKRNTKHEEKRNNSEGEKGAKRSGNEGNYELTRAAERGGEFPQVLGVPRNFCWSPVFFLGEIFPRKGQDICFFGQSTEIWYEKLR